MMRGFSRLRCVARSSGKVEIFVARSLRYLPKPDSRMFRPYILSGKERLP